MRKRTLAVLLAVLLVFSGLSLRVFQLSDESLLAASLAQSTRKHVVATARGTIYDRYLSPLVNRERRIAALLTPTQSAQEMLKQQQKTEEVKRAEKCLEKGDCAIVHLPAWAAPMEGVAQFFVPVRYSENALACHVIGYVNGEFQGVTGIEKGYNERLSTYSGEASASYAVDALGRVQTDVSLRTDNTLSHCAGGVALTIDSQIQESVQNKAAAYMERGVVLVSAVNSGDVLASVSLPQYDPDNVQAELEDVAAPLLDRTTVNYNIGSVFKIVTAAAALEQGISPNTVYTCTGAYTVNNVTIRCHNPLGDGAITMGEAMALSCNCYFMQLAQAVGADALYETAVKAGLTESYILANGCVTARGVLPSQEDLSSEAALANFSIGQGDLLLTPYHVHRIMQAVANGGSLCMPNLYLGAVNEKGLLVAQESESEHTQWVSAATADTLFAMLAEVVEYGTGVEASTVIGGVVGKTGTAETGWVVDGERFEQSWFTGCYPAENPQYVITVLSENGGNNGRTAAPLFAQICEVFLQAGLVENAQELY